MNTLAAIINGETDLAEVCLLVAVIVFAVATVVRVIGRAVDSALVAFGLAAVALAFLVM